VKLPWEAALRGERMNVMGERLGVVAVCGLLAACGGERGSVWTAADSADVAAAVPAAPARTRPADAQIARVLGEANGIAERAAQHARTRVRTPAVAEYAATVAADHRAMGAPLEPFVRDSGAAGAAHPLARELRTAGAAALEALGALSGPSYESAYIEDQIAFHQRALGVIDDVLIPSAENERLVALLRNLRPAYAAHLQRALQIRQLLAAGAGTPDSAAIRP
jgi:putative membrane protein